MARCLQDDSWKRGRILKTEMLSVTVFYLDVGTVETLSDPDRLADIPWDEEKKPGVVRCCLENGPYWDKQAKNHLLQHVYILQVSWRLLVLRIEMSGAVLVSVAIDFSIFLQTRTGQSLLNKLPGLQLDSESIGMLSSFFL